MVFRPVAGTIKPSTRSPARYAALVENHADFADLDAALARYGWLVRETDPALSDALFERLRTEYPQSRFVPEATLRLAERALDAENLDSAERLLSQLATADLPAELQPQALYLSGRLKLAQSQWAAARESLEKLLADDPGGELALPAQYLLAEACDRQGDDEQAVRLYEELANETRDRTDDWLATAELHRAQALAQLRRWDEAAQVARGIAERFAGFDRQYEADYVIGRAYAAQADFNSARQWYAQAIDAPGGAASETGAMARWMTGESYFYQKNYAAALAAYLQVDDRYPRWHAAALLQAGKAQEALGHWQPAAELYAQLLDRYPDGELSAEAASRLAAARQRAASPPAATKQK